MSLVISFFLVMTILLFPGTANHINAFTERVLFAWAIASQDIPHQADAAMIQKFVLYKNDFERLRQMISRDKDLQRVDDTWVAPKDFETRKKGQARIADYRKIFTRIGVPRGIEAYDLFRKKIHFIASTQGLSVSGSAKGYAYLEEQPPVLYNDLDKRFSEMGRREETSYRHIEGNWYLYVEKE